MFSRHTTSLIAAILFINTFACRPDARQQPSAAQDKGRTEPAPPVAPAPQAKKDPEASPPSAEPDFHPPWQLDLSSAPSLVGAGVVSADQLLTVDGPQRPILIVRCKDQKLDVIVNAHSLADTVEAEGGRRRVLFRVQYDSGPQRSVLAMESPDEMLFSWPEPRLEIANIKKAKTLRVWFPQFQKGEAAFSFDLSRFGEAREELKSDCPSLP